MVTEKQQQSLEGHQLVGSAPKLCWSHFMLHTGRVSEVRKGKDRREKLTLEGRGGWEYIWLTAFC